MKPTMGGQVVRAKQHMLLHRLAPATNKQPTISVCVEYRTSPCARTAHGLNNAAGRECLQVWKKNGTEQRRIAPRYRNIIALSSALVKVWVQQLGVRAAGRLHRHNSARQP
jgi:hypothetical protein